MLSIRKIIRPAAVALAFALVAAPVAAHAEGKDRSAEVKKQRKFPMPAESFNKLIEKRLTKAREHLVKALDKRNVPEATKVQATKDFDAGAAAVRSLSAKVRADGTVTKEEAKQVRDLAKDLKQKAREKYGIGKGKGKNKGKDQGQQGRDV
ncbi:MAG: hypothetical protein L6Q76_26420 [Polyangiaceae bacterium]|nr:hypothetical protein [Polyangiaceae bacterium]